MWNLDWIIVGTLALLMAVMNIVFAIKAKGKWPYAVMFCSLCLGATALFEELKTVESWIEYEEVVALESLPRICNVISVAFPVLVVINLIALIVMLKRDEKKISKT